MDRDVEFYEANGIPCNLPCWGRQLDAQCISWTAVVLCGMVAWHSKAEVGQRHAVFFWESGKHSWIHTALATNLFDVVQASWSSHCCLTLPPRRGMHAGGRMEMELGFSRTCKPATPPAPLWLNAPSEAETVWHRPFSLGNPAQAPKRKSFQPGGDWIEHEGEAKISFRQHHTLHRLEHSRAPSLKGARPNA